jgi:acyl carrier protein
MNTEQIRATVLRVLKDIAPEADTASIDPNVSFHDQFEIDSIDFLRLMMELQKELKVSIFDFDFPKLSTLTGCERYLVDKLNALEA